MNRIVSVDVPRDHVLRLTFSDGSRGEVDVSGDLWGPVFEPLRDPARFREVRVDPELGTVTWPNGADLDPDSLWRDVHRDRTGAGLVAEPVVPNA